LQTLSKGSVSLNIQTKLIESESSGQRELNLPQYSKCSSSSLQEEFVNEPSILIDSALPQYEKTMHTAARLILDYELYFLDRIYKHSINK
jgi:hypothetical protein